ncbi:MAG: pentapeptide repeat-containing protein [Candidatus Latescibacterota bacterium]|nr:pentapeptide repeat-containing protein [Candidatus Latescibacterota bacterium]
MPQCEYIGPSGNQCNENADEGKSICFWHDRDADKSGDDIKERLEQKARAMESCEGYELMRANLEDAFIIELDLSYANLERVNLQDGSLFGINLRGANLMKANLRDSNLRESKLEGADLLGAYLDGADLDRAEWGEGYIVRSHRMAEDLASQGNKLGANEQYQRAEDTYRIIRQRYEANGQTEFAGRFFYNEMVSKRKQMPKWSVRRFWSKLVDVICGYGEDPMRVINFSFSVVVISALIFSLTGMTHGDNTYVFHLTNSIGENLRILAFGIYYSIVTFTTLGYGDMVALGWGKAAAALEAFAGVFLNSIFLLTFAKKMIR